MARVLNPSVQCSSIVSSSFTPLKLLLHSIWKQAMTQVLQSENNIQIDIVKMFAWTLWWGIEFEDFPLKASYVVWSSNPVLYHLYLSRRERLAVLITLWQSKWGCGPKLHIDIDLSLSFMLLFSFSVDDRCFMLTAQQNERNNYLLLVYLYRCKCAFILVIIYAFNTQQ